MILKINYFGLVAEATQCSRQNLTVTSPCTLEELTQHLYQLYPTLQEKPFRIAVNRVFVPSYQALEATDEIALLPPFAGG